MYLYVCPAGVKRLPVFVICSDNRAASVAFLQCFSVCYQHETGNSGRDQQQAENLNPC